MGHGFHDLQLPETPTVGDLRRALAEKTKLRPEALRIGQDTAVSGDGEKVFAVKQEGGGRDFYTTAAGEEVEERNERLDVLENDEELFVLPPQRCLLLSIQRR